METIRRDLVQLEEEGFVRRTHGGALLNNAGGVVRKGEGTTSGYWTSAEKVFASGNVVHVNDLVDNVSTESMKAGKFAAQYAMGTLPEEKKVIENVTGNNAIRVILL